jgi:hypothetical protein
MDGENLVGSFLEDVSRPKRAIDFGAEIFEFGGQAAVEYVDAIED